MNTVYKKELARLDDVVQHLIQQVLDGEDGFTIRKRRVRVIDSDNNSFEDMGGRYASPIITVDTTEESAFQNSYVLSFSDTRSVNHNSNQKNIHLPKGSDSGNLELAPLYTQIDGIINVRVPGSELYDKYLKQLDAANESYQTQRLCMALDYTTKTIGYDRAYKLKNLLEE